MELRTYLNDGANYQAQAVLAYVRGYINRVEDLGYDFDKNWYRFHITVGRYENCREQGYVFTICYKGKQRNWAVYEHRNSDRIIVLISNAYTINTPNVDQMWADKGENPSKYDYDKAFDCDCFAECGDYIIEDMIEFVKPLIEKTNE